MKRSEYLKTLSWEHHDGLVVSFRLQQGIKKEVHPDEMAQYIIHTWTSELKHHFWQEEQIIIPILNKSEKGKELVNQMQSDHNKIDQIVKKIDSKNNSVNYIEEFASLLNQHIRFEERQLFPIFEQETSTKKLQKVGEFLIQHHNPVCEVWPNQFWKKK